MCDAPASPMVLGLAHLSMRQNEAYMRDASRAPAGSTVRRAVAAQRDAWLAARAAEAANLEDLITPP